LLARADAGKSGVPLLRLADAVRHLAGEAKMREGDIFGLLADRIEATGGLPAFVLQKGDRYAEPVTTETIFEREVSAVRGGVQAMRSSATYSVMDWGQNSASRFKVVPSRAAKPERRGIDGAAAILRARASSAAGATALDSSREVIAWLALRKADIEGLLRELRGEDREPLRLVAPSTAADAPASWDAERVATRIRESEGDHSRRLQGVVAESGLTSKAISRLLNEWWTGERLAVRRAELLQLTPKVKDPTQVLENETGIKERTIQRREKATVSALSGAAPKHRSNGESDPSIAAAWSKSPAGTGSARRKS
jgi:hypothetical protein